MEEEKVYTKILPKLKSFLIWCHHYNNVDRFDIDDIFQDALSEYNITMAYGILNKIYTLTDSIYDAVTHDQMELIPAYSLVKGLEDLNYIIQDIEKKGKVNLNENLSLLKRLNSLLRYN